MKSRIVIIFIGFATLWSLILLRVFILQIFPHQKLERLETKQYETTVKIEGRRGSIYDRNGVELAISAPASSLYADPQLIWPERQLVAQKLEKILGLKYKEILKMVKDKNRRFVWIDRQLPIDKVEKIKRLKIRGLGFIEEPVRVYPDEDILKSVLGVVGRSGMGLEGIEKQYESTLRGNPRKIQVRRDARGRPLQVNGLLVTENEEGTDVQLTIDRELQYILHRELKKTVQDQEAAGAVGIILDAQTSEVRAMDAIGLPMGGEKLAKENWRNRPILESFEPGSTMKTFVIAAGLQEKKWQPNTRFDCENGTFKIGKRTIGEADSHHHFGLLTISEILAFSSNIGMTKMAFALGEQTVRQNLTKFGFGQRTGIDLPGEAIGIVQSGKWGLHLLSNISFGHGVSVTPIQIANAYAAIANGGILKKPRITKQIEMQSSSWNPLSSSWKLQNSILNISDLNNSDKKFDGKSDETSKSGIRILTEAQAQTLRLLLAGVTAKGGTGVSAVVPGYPVAGKTGTAQKVNPNGRGYLPGVYISSFAGIIPANEPRFVIYVAVDSPVKQYYGSQVAGPLFSRIATFAVRHEGIAPRWLNEQQALGFKTNFSELKSDSEDSNNVSNFNSHTTSNKTSNTTSNAKENVKENVKANQSGNSVSNTKVSAVSNEALTETIEIFDTMPNLNKLTLREVHESLQNRELKVILHGSGQVSRFNPPEGTPLKENDSVEVWLTQ